MLALIRHAGHLFLILAYHLMLLVIGVLAIVGR